MWTTEKVWDAELGILLHTLAEHTGPSYYVTFSADSRWLASASEDMTLRLYETEAFKVKHVVQGHTDGIPVRPQ